ncbi:branched-chain amino acid ABC transporter permease [Hyperthermus butylicus]|uniref:branched-chain amino acid ABC transporter permease n=1 Tax=Hyperthermus butylicus TaxID=54248 RepID=UPI0003264499|nr:branched-chain amino acid ABC transporter permease [Hyperthermus butylicus]
MDVVSFLVQYLVVAGVYSLLAISMNIEYGWAGIPNFGKAAFIAAGGIAAAITATRIGPPLLLGMDPASPATLDFFGYYNGAVLPAYQQHPLDTWLVFAISALIGGAIAVVMAVAFSYPAVRLREDYLAIALLMAAQLVWLVIRVYKPIMGGTMSLPLPGPDFKSIAARIAGPNPPAVLVDTLRALFVWGLVILYLYYVEKQMNSPFGRKLRMIRDDEVAAEALGRNVARARLEAMVIGSFLAGIAGAVYSLVYFSSVNPDNYLPELTFLVLTFVLVGGVGNNVGSILGAAAMAFIERLSYTVGTNLAAFHGLDWGSYIYYLVYGLAIILAIFFRPYGLLPEKPVRTPAWKVYMAVRGKTPPFMQNILDKLRMRR